MAVIFAQKNRWEKKTKPEVLSLRQILVLAPVLQLVEI